MNTTELQTDKFLFYESYFEAIEDLNSIEEKASAYNAFFTYAFKGKLINMPKSFEIVFKAIRPSIDQIKKNYANGKKGGRPKKNESIKKQQKKTPEIKTEIEEEQEPLNTKKEEFKTNIEPNNIIEPGNINEPSSREVKEFADSIGSKQDIFEYITQRKRKNWKDENGNPITDWREDYRKWDSEKETKK